MNDESVTTVTQVCKRIANSHFDFVIHAFKINNRSNIFLESYIDPIIFQKLNKYIYNTDIRLISKEENKFEEKLEISNQIKLIKAHLVINHDEFKLPLSEEGFELLESFHIEEYVITWKILSD